MKRFLLIALCLFTVAAVHAQKVYERQTKGAVLPKEILQTKLLIFSPFRDDQTRNDKFKSIAAQYKGPYELVAKNGVSPLAGNVDSGYRYALIVERNAYVTPGGVNETTYTLILFDMQHPKIVAYSEKIKAMVARGASQKEIMKAINPEDIPAPMVQMDASRDWDGALKFLLEKLNTL